jgi:hypothetical protein
MNMSRNIQIWTKTFNFWHYVLFCIITAYEVLFLFKVYTALLHYTNYVQTFVNYNINVRYNDHSSVYRKYYLLGCDPV